MGLGKWLGAGLSLFTGNPLPLMVGMSSDVESGQQDTNAQNIALSREQMAFQERMSNTAYPRAVQGMKDAGLNPMLAYSQGGASSPGGAMATTQNPEAAGMGSAQQAGQTLLGLEQMKQTRAGTENLAAQTDKIRSETIANQINTAQAMANLQRTQEEIPGVHGRSQSDLVKSFVERGMGGHEQTGFAADVARRKAEAELTALGLPEAKSIAHFYESNFGKFEPYLGQILRILTGITTAAKAVRGGLK